MKKSYLLLAALFILKTSFATTHLITVSNFQFSPATVNAVVGDTIKWVWGSGNHTTTSVTIPAGATAWNSEMDTLHQRFLYKLTVAGTYNYKCIPHAAFGMVATLTVTGALPVVLSNFGVASSKANAALISWSTASEQNTDHFEINRSSDGKSFSKIAMVAAAGNSSLTHNYSYTDNTLPGASRYVYYSLTVVDKDGRKTLSGIKMLTDLNANAKLVVSISPNPISRPGHLMLQFNADKDGSMHVALYNAQGKLVQQDDMSAVAGLNNGHLHISDISAGVYTAVFSMNGVKESYRIVIE